MNTISRLVLAACAILISADALAQSPKPWALRDHYQIKHGAAAYWYDVSTSEWQVTIDGLGTIFNNVASEIRLAGEEPIRLSSLTIDRDERENFKDELGEGTYFRTVYKPHRGLSVRYSIRRFTNRPFVMMRIEVRNDGDRPVHIESIRPAVMANGCIAQPARSATVRSTHTAQRGGFPMIVESEESTLIQFAFKNPNLLMGMGVLPTGTADVSVRLDRSKPEWTGHAGVSYQPPIRLEPGDSLRADPVWLAFIGGTKDEIRRFYSWSRSVLPSTQRAPIVPSSWVTVDGNQPVDVLYETARSWRGNGVEHVLVPGNWETVPGSLRPRVPNYPAEMRDVSGAIKSIGMIPGIAFDPLAAGPARNDAVYEASDGSRWIIPKDRNDVQFAVRRAGNLQDWGFRFFVVEPSRIPDEALAHGNLTRAEADVLAFSIMVQAAKNRPVLPSPAMTIDGNPARWAIVAETTLNYTDYGIAAGPIRFDTNNLNEVPGSLLETIQSFAGPIELTGIPSSKVQRSLGPALINPQWAQAIASLRRPAEASSGRRR